MVGVGAALAKAERERRRARLARTRQFALLPEEGHPEGLRRIALGQLDLAIELLAGETDARSEAHAVHETRKALKRLRALLGLMEDLLGEETCARERRALRDVGRRLSGARDSEVMEETLEALIERHPKKLGRRRSIARLRRRVALERHEARGRTLGDAQAVAVVLGELHASRARVMAWALPARGGLTLVEPALARIYGEGRRRHRRAARGRGERTLELHEWRKRVKDLRYAAEMLERSDPEAARGNGKNRTGGRDGKGAKDARCRGESGRERRAAPRIRRLARRADELGELLGEEHDLALLAARIEAEAGGRGTVKISRRTCRTLQKLIARRRRELRRRALRAGERLYDRRPREFADRLSRR